MYPCVDGVLADPDSPTHTARRFISNEAQFQCVSEERMRAMGDAAGDGSRNAAGEEFVGRRREKMFDQLKPDGELANQTGVSTSQLKVAQPLMEPSAQAYLTARGGEDDGTGSDSTAALPMATAALPTATAKLDALFTHPVPDDRADLRGVNTEFECSDLMIKILILSRRFPTLYDIQKSLSYTMDLEGREVCDHYNSMLANIAFNRDERIANEYADTFRDALVVSHTILKHAVYNPMKYHDGSRMSEDDVYRLDVSMVDTLRTCCFIGSSSTHSSTQREYSKTSCSVEAQLRSKMCNFMRSGNEHAQQAYATADKMFENFDDGLANLLQLTLKSDTELVAFLNNGKEQTKLFMNCFMFPSIFDGNRMRCANAIAARFYAFKDQLPHEAFGTSAQVAGVFDSNASMVSTKRVIYTICAILSMAKANLWLASSQKVASRACARAAVSAPVVDGSNSRTSQTAVNAAIHAEASKLPQWQEAATIYCKIIDIAHKKMSRGGHPDAPGATTEMIDYMATWFEDGARCASKFSLLSAAFTHDAFCIDRPDRKVREKWRQFRKDNGIESNTNASLWLASQFLVSCRLEMHDISVCGSNIITAACIVFSGAISRLVDNADDPDPCVRGPFKFAPHVVKSAKSMFSSFSQRIARERASPHPNATTETQDQSSKSCKSNNITNRILQESCIRKTHEKSDLVATRLSACLFMLSVKEMLMADIDPTLDKLPPIKLGVTASPHEGRKDLRRMYIIALQTLSCLKYARCRKMNVTHLIEQNRKRPESKQTTGDNVEKPWRDILGTMLIGTLFYPTAGQAFIATLRCLPATHPVHRGDRDASTGLDDDAEDLMSEKRPIEDDSFVCRTYEAVNVFRKCFQNKLDHFYPLADSLPTSIGPFRDGTSHARMIMGQQISFAMSFIKCIENCGPLWEGMQLTFSIQTKPSSKQDRGFGRDGEDDDDDAFHRPPPPQLAMAAGSSAVGQHGEDIAARGQAAATVEATGDFDDDDDDDFWETPTTPGIEPPSKAPRVQ